MANPFQAPRDWTFSVADIRVAFERGGEFDYTWSDPTLGKLGKRLRVSRIEHGVNKNFPRAAIQLNLAAEYDGAGQELSPPMMMGDLPSLIPPDARMVIYAEVPTGAPGGGPSTRRFLFDGYPRVQRIPFTAKDGGNFMEYSIVGMSLMERLGRERDAWCYGRWMPNPSTLVGAPQHCESLPTIFNFDDQPGRRARRGNRHPDLFTVNGIDNVPLFTYDGDPRAVHWTYADALMYLLACYLPPLGGSFPLKDGNGISRVKDIVAANTGPALLASPSDATFDQVVGTKCDELSVEGKSLLDALLAWCRLTGCMMQQWTFNEDGNPATKLLFSLAGEGGPWATYGSDSAERTIKDDEYTTSPTPRALWLAKEGAFSDNGDPLGETCEGELQLDASGVIASCRVIGSPIIYEVTAGKGPHTGDKWFDLFRPGWKPDSTFGDNLSGAALTAKLTDIAAVAKDASGTPLAMFQRYARSGVSHSNYLMVGRLWVLDEAGELAAQAASYARSNGGSLNWSQNVYASPYNFHVNCGVPYLADPVTGDLNRRWVLRRRRILRPLSQAVGVSASEAPVPINPHVICSFDSGANWSTYPGNCRFLEDRIGIILTDNTLKDSHLVQNNKSLPSYGKTVWAAIVDGTFRIACTFSVESDAVVRAESASAPGAYTTLQPHITLSVRDAMRGEFQASSSEFKDSDWHQFIERDESSNAQSLANRYVGICQARVIGGNLVVPWHTLDYLCGDLLTGIQPRGVNFNVLRVASQRYPQVVAVAWINGDGVPETHITLDDMRAAIRKAAVEQET